MKKLAIGLLMVLSMAQTASAQIPNINVQINNVKSKTNQTEFQVNISNTSQFDINKIKGQIAFTNTTASELSGVEIFQNPDWVSVPLESQKTYLMGYVTLNNELELSQGQVNLYFRAPLTTRVQTINFTLIDTETNQPLNAGFITVDLSNPNVRGTSVYKFTQNLQIGTSSAAVRELQKRLVAEGYLKTPATGYFGTYTQSAVLAYQKAHGINATGIVGPITRASLNK